MLLTCAATSEPYSWLFDVGGAEFLSFLLPVTKGGGGREGCGEVVAPIVLLVHVCPEVAEIWEAFSGEAFRRGRGCCGLHVKSGLGRSWMARKRLIKCGMWVAESSTRASWRRLRSRWRFAPGSLEDRIGWVMTWAAS